MPYPTYKLSWKAQPASELARYPLMAALRSPEEQPPPSIDLSQGWPVECDQTPADSCVAFGTIAAMEYVIRSNAIVPTPLSARFVYYNARVLVDGTLPNVDKGCRYISSGITALQQNGTAPEALFPYRVSGYADTSERPPEAAYTAALDFQLVRATRIAMDTQSLRAAIASGAPVAAGFRCFENLYDNMVRSTGVIQMPAGIDIGGHCVLFVGYDDDKKLFKFRNSWGSDWGDKGYGYLPYDYADRADGWSILEAEERGEIKQLINKRKAMRFGLVQVKGEPGRPISQPVAPINNGASDSNYNRAVSRLFGTYTGPEPGRQLKLMSVALLGVSEEASSIIADFQTGYATTGSAGLTVQKGTSARLTFRMTMRAMTTSQINDLDSKLTETFSEEEKSTYKRAKQSYNGGFNIPCLSWFGLNLGASYEKETVDQARQYNSNYDRQAREVRQALEQKTKQVISVEGELTATGTSFIPTEVYAYVKVAQLRLTNGKTLNVVNVDTPDGAVAADKKGKAVPTEGQKLKLLSFT